MEVCDGVCEDSADGCAVAQRRSRPPGEYLLGEEGV